jgi:5-(carboxyamino)imidazole ribonucleotide mutase
MSKKGEPKIAIVVGSKSDVATLKEGMELLEGYNIPYTLNIISAHRHPEKLRMYCKNIEKKSTEVIIACAGFSAALPGFIASYVRIPVIGVPFNAGSLGGLESLLSIVEVPKGIGLVSAGIGKKGFINAVLCAVKILSLSHREYRSFYQQLVRKFKK